MARIISETKGKANPKRSVSQSKNKNDREKILDNRELRLDVFVVHAHIIDRVGGRCKLYLFFLFSCFILLDLI